MSRDARHAPRKLLDVAEERYEFTGTQTEIIRQIGNAVPVRMMQACVTAMFASEAEPDMLEAAE